MSGPPIDNYDNEKHAGKVLEEKKTGPVADAAAESTEVGQLRRGLHQRHIQMIALAGTLGTGLFLASGESIQKGGPLGALLGYTIIGTAAMGAVLAVGEMGALVPLNGGIIRYTDHFVDPSLAFANGWNLVFAHLVSIPSEAAAGAVLISFWSDVNSAVFITVLGLLMLVVGLLFIRVYGELEYGFSILKILLVLFLNILALVITTGGAPNHEAIGFRYWVHPGPFTQYFGIEGALGRFLGFYAVFNSAVYAYSGIENISLAAAETRSPRVSIPQAAKRVFWKILLFYVITIFFVGLIVPSDNPFLLKSTGDAAESPFVIAATLAGIKVVPSVINAIVLTSAWSAGNSTLLGGSRILYGMAAEGKAPKMFLKTNRFGVPHYSVLFHGAFIALAYLSVSATSEVAFNWLKDLVSIATLVNWVVISFTYLRFYYGCRKQSISRASLPWMAPMQPYLTWWSLFLQVLLLITGGFSTFIRGHWSSETFVSSYVNIPIFIILWLGYKYTTHAKLIPLDEIPIRHFLDIYHRELEEKGDDEVPEARKRSWWVRWLTALWT